MANRIEDSFTTMAASGTVTFDFDFQTPNHHKYRDGSSAMTGNITLALTNAIDGDTFSYFVKNTSGSPHDLTLPAGRGIGGLTSLTTTIADGDRVEVTGKRLLGEWLFSLSDSTALT